MAWPLSRVPVSVSLSSGSGDAVVGALAPFSSSSSNRRARYSQWLIYAIGRGAPSLCDSERRTEGAGRTVTLTTSTTAEESVYFPLWHGNVNLFQCK